MAIADSSVSSNSIHNDITFGEEALFELNIINNEPTEQRYSIYSIQDGIEWNVEATPLRDKIVTIAGKSSRKVQIKARALEHFTPAIYHVAITIESDLGERYVIPLKIYYAAEGPIEYLPALQVTVDMDEKITPKKPAAIKLFLENRNPLNLTGVTARIQSDVPEFVKQTQVNLEPLEETIIEFTIVPREFLEPKEYTLFFVFERFGQPIKVVEKIVEVETLLPAFLVHAREENVFLNKFVALDVTNEGNVRNTQKVRVDISFWEALLVKGDFIIDTSHGRQLVWEMALGPNETQSLQYRVNYRTLLYFGLVLLVILIFYMMTVRPIVVHKQAVVTRGGDDGAMSEIKVTLEFRNKTKKPIKDVSIIDWVPAIANIEKSLELGTLKPQEITHSKQQTKVVWGLHELDGLEHRVITYKIRAKLNIVGTFKLPRAEVEFGSRGQKKKKAFSNVVNLSS